MMGTFPKNKHLVEKEVGELGSKFRKQQVPTEFMAVTLVKLAMKVMSSGFCSLGRPGISRRSLVDRNRWERSGRSH